MRVARRVEAGNALIEIPAERADNADIVVVPHVAVGHEVEAGLFLVTDDRSDGVRIGFLVGDFLEGDPHIPAQ